MERTDFRLLKELISQVPCGCALEGIGVHLCWSLFKSNLLRLQDQAIPKCQKSSKRDTRLAWLSRDLFLELRQKRKECGHWKQGQVTWEDYRNSVCHCREKICADKAQLKLKLASAVGDNKKRVV